MTAKIITGIGSRTTPAAALTLLSDIAAHFSREGYTLRSGGAEGADTAFEEQFPPDRREIFLPWKKFNKNKSPLFHIDAEAYEIAAENHPYYSTMSEAAKKLIARNVYQILGRDFRTPASLCVAYTEAEGVGHGGTCFTLKLADIYNVPTYNVFYQHELDELRWLVREGKI